MCRLSATLSYLSTLPLDSLTLPSAVGHASVPFGIGNITNASRTVNMFFKKIVSGEADFVAKTLTFKVSEQQ